MNNAKHMFESPMYRYYENGFVAGYGEGYIAACEDFNNILHKEELDFLVNKLSNDITSLEMLITLEKDTCNYFYSFCNPDDESTKVHYKYLNNTKSDLRKLVKKRNKLAAIQGKLKKLRSA